MKRNLLGVVLGYLAAGKTIGGGFGGGLSAPRRREDRKQSGPSPEMIKAALDEQRAKAHSAKAAAKAKFERKRLAREENKRRSIEGQARALAKLQGNL